MLPNTYRSRARWPRELVIARMKNTECVAVGVPDFPPQSLILVGISGERDHGDMWDVVLCWRGVPMIAHEVPGVYDIVDCSDWEMSPVEKAT